MGQRARRAVRFRSDVSEDGEELVSLTKQSFKRECDINTIMAKYAKGQVVDHLARHGGSYGDFSSQDFHEAMNIVRKGEEMFLDLDSGLRRRFGNDPAVFLEFVQDPKNASQLIELGLAEAPRAPSAAAEPEAPVE